LKKRQFGRFGVQKNWTIPYAVFLLVFVITPLILIAIYAFTDADGQFSLANFQKFIHHGETVNTFVYSIGIALITTSVIVMLFILPMWINTLIRTLATVALFDFLQLPLGEGALIFWLVYNFLPFMIYPIYNVLNKTDHSLTEAAQDLGACPLKVFTRVTLPLSMPGVTSGILMVFMPTVSTFAIAELLTLNNIKLLGTTVQENINNGMWNYGAAISLVMLLLIGVSSLFTDDKSGEEGGLL